MSRESFFLSFLSPSRGRSVRYFEWESRTRLSATVINSDLFTRSLPNRGGDEEDDQMEWGHIPITLSLNSFVEWSDVWLPACQLIIPALLACKPITLPSRHPGRPSPPLPISFKWETIWRACKISLEIPGDFPRICQRWNSTSPNQRERKCSITNLQR